MNEVTDTDEDACASEITDKDTQNVTDAKNDAVIPWWIIIIGIVVILIGVGAFIVVKKKNR